MRSTLHPTVRPRRPTLTGVHHGLRPRAVRRRPSPLRSFAALRMYVERWWRDVLRRLLAK